MSHLSYETTYELGFVICWIPMSNVSCLTIFHWCFLLSCYVLLEQTNSNGKRTKLAGSKHENGGSKAEAEASSVVGDKPAEQPSKPSEPSKQDYIHVRARRGQATDSHSLAERVMFIKSFLVSAN